MTKQEFLAQLRESMVNIPQEEREERLTFYEEMINDRMEEGLLEEDAVSQISTDITFSKTEEEKVTVKRKHKSWETVTIVVGSPLWIVLSIALVAITISLFASLWSLVGSAWSVFVSLCAGALVGVVECIVFACLGTWSTGFAFLGLGLVCGGLSILAFFGCKEATKGSVWLTKKFVLWVKSWFKKKEEI